MPVDPGKPRKVLVVHGVQSGTDVDLDQDRLVAALIEARLGGLPLQYEVDLCRYENINDRALAKFKRLIGLIAATPLNAAVAGAVLDLVGDVVVALADDSTANTIRAGLRKPIFETYELGQPCYVVAHSLGSIYAFDVINELMKTSAYFDRGSGKSWPVQGDAIVFRGTPGQDRLAGQSESVDRNQECGRFLHYHRFVAIDPGSIQLTIHCEPLTNAFSIGRANLQARPERYTFPIEVTRHWSLFGGMPDIPAPPACR